MSDYEGEWEPIVIRGNPFTPSAPLSVPPDPAHNYIVPKGRSLEEAEQAKREKKDRSRKSSAVILPRDYRKSLQAFKPGVGSGKYSSQDARAEKPYESVQKRVQSLPAFQKYKARPNMPDDVFQMVRSIKNIIATLPKQQNLQPSDVFRDRLAAICIDSRAYIAIVEGSENACQIWGEPDEVRRAKEGLYAFEMNAAAPTKNQKTVPAWDKINAFDGRAENRLMRENWMIRQRQFFQQETDDTMMPYQAHLYWPDGYDLDNFIEDYNDTVLQDLMNKYDCIIKQQRAERITKVACDTQQVLFQVYNRLMGLMREMIARKQSGLYATHCEVPGANVYRDRIKLRKMQAGGDPVNIPLLTGKPLPGSEHEPWTQLSSDINRKYRLATKNALRSCINAMHLSKKFLQLRVIFGDLGLVQVMKPAEGQETYHIDDFLTKVQRPGTKVAQCPLQEGTSFQLIDAIDTCSEFSSLDISWEVSFDFTGGHNKTLRLLKEFSPNVIDPDEPSVAATRWLMYSDTLIEDKSDLLSINHIDLERVGFQLYLGGGTLFQNERTLHDLRNFQNNIRFKPSLNGMRYEPSKHVIYPYGNQELTCMREITIAKYQFKETRGTFEVRRTDHFNARPGEASPIPYRTDWSATYYYAGWDSLLSEFANIEPGQDIQWKRDIKTFFPKIEDPDNPQILPHGFKSFMKEVDEIQTLIARALGRSKGDQSGQNTRSTNGEKD